MIVAVSGIGFAAHSWVENGDSFLSVQWVMWSILWAAFFVLMVSDNADLAPSVGVLAIGNAILTTGVPGFLTLSGYRQDSPDGTVIMAVFGVIILISCHPLGRLLTTHSLQDEISHPDHHNTQAGTPHP